MKLTINLISILLGILLIGLCSSPVFAEIPNDPLYSDPIYGQPYLKHIDAESAWDVSTGSKSVIVGIIDSGVDYTHPDLIDNLWNENGEYGFIVTDTTNDVMDVSGHGTMCAGILGAVGNNLEGITGTIWDVKMLAVNALNKTTDKYDDCKKAAQIAIDHGARIISMSFGYDKPIVSDDIDLDKSYWASLFRGGDNENVLFVIAAGNENRDTVNSPAYLADEYPNVIAVGGTDNYDKRAVWLGEASNYGNEITLVAPATYIHTTCLPSLMSIGLSTDTPLDFRYTWIHSGTSFAVPFVAGAAALLKSIDPSLSASQLKEKLVNSSDDIEWMPGKTVKRLNLNKAVREVYTAVTSISISGDTSVFRGSAIQLSATVSPSDATNKAVIWSSSNTGVATVDETGRVTGKSIGIATITATSKSDRDVKATRQITVEEPIVSHPVTGITINGASSVTVGSTTTLSVTITPADADNKAVSWSSSDTSKATVSSSGVVTGKSAGSVTITATAQDDSGVYGQKTITVSEAAPSTTPVTSITISGSSSVTVGSTISLSASVSPSTATNKAVSWSSSDTSKATVSSSGVVTGKSTGTVTITATAQDGSGIYGQKTITVSAAPPSTIPVTSITISGSSSVYIGETISLSASVSPSTATNKAVSWSSSNTGRATVSSSGVVTGKSAGTVTITATAQDGSGVYAQKTITVNTKTVYVTSISVSGSASVYVGETITLSASVSPSTATNKAVSWSSSNTGVATVSSSGVVTGKSAGSVTITATAQDGSWVSGTKSITVSSKTTTPYISEIKLAIDSNANTAKQFLRNGGYTVIDTDLNEGSKAPFTGRYIYLGYKTSTTQSDAITGIVAKYYDSDQRVSSLTYGGNFYNLVDAYGNDAGMTPTTNYGSWGGKPVYIYTTNSSSAGNPITTIGLTATTSEPSTYGKTYVRFTNDNTIANLNKDAWNGKFIGLYLTYG